MILLCFVAASLFLCSLTLILLPEFYFGPRVIVISQLSQSCPCCRAQQALLLLVVMKVWGGRIMCSCRSWPQLPSPPDTVGKKRDTCRKLRKDQQRCQHSAGTNGCLCVTTWYLVAVLPGASPHTFSRDPIFFLVSALRPTVTHLNICVTSFQVGLLGLLFFSVWKS